MRILVAEDDPISRRIITSTVEQLGHECFSAEDGLSAWQIFQNTPGTEVVISDWMMPGIDGIEFCRRVRAVNRPGYTFFIFLTALGGREQLLKGMKAGADEYLTKPLDEAQLCAKLVVASRIASLYRHLDASDDQTGVIDESSASARASQSMVQVVLGNTRLKSGNVWDILISEGKLSEEQLQRALEAQETDRRELGEVLVSLGFISEEDLARAQARRLGLEYMDLSEADVDRNAMSLVDQKVLRRHGVVPLRIEDESMVLAMEDPTNLYAIEDMRIISGYPIVPVVATETRILEVQAGILPQ